MTEIHPTQVKTNDLIKYRNSIYLVKSIKNSSIGTYGKIFYCLIVQSNSPGLRVGGITDWYLNSGDVYLLGQQDKAELV